CMDQIRTLISYLPQNNLEKAERLACDLDPNALQASLNAIIPQDPRSPYDMKSLIGQLADPDSFFEVQAYFAQNIITGFIRLNGESVGVIANQPRVMAGVLDIDASDKASRFIRTCDAFNIPLLTLVDVPGFLPGTQQEYGGIIRHGAKMLFAYSEATVPKVTLIVRKAYGGAYIGMCSKHLGGDIVLAWPDAEIAVMGAEGAANIIFSREIRAAEDPEAKRQEKIDEYADSMMNPYVAAQRGYLDDVILPQETRQRLISSFDSLRGKREAGPAKKHGNMPL
ncbi:MAG TPA: carboxyl transferase domain-containing protein, partial [Clostridia bacterium]|nr:carboxyl transferase domain-containing protein [Clostridia bacterium]